VVALAEHYIRFPPTSDYRTDAVHFAVAISPREDPDMTDRAADVVDRFRRLTLDEQVEAYIDIEGLWRELQEDGAVSNTPTRPLLE
jgi:hypothetical protein